MKENMSIFRYYRSNFIRMVCIPLITTFVIGMLIVINEADKSEKRDLQLITENLVTQLDSDLSDNSVELSYFISNNNREVLKLLTEYQTASAVERYDYIVKLNQLYQMRFIRRQYAKVLDFYMDPEEQYSFYFTKLIPESEARRTQWYQTATEKADIINKFVVPPEDVYTSTKYDENDRFLLFTIRFEELGVGTDVDMATLVVQSEALQQIVKAHTWLDGVELYLVDVGGEILASSSNKYDSNIVVDNGKIKVTGDKIKYSVDTMNKERWRVVAISDSLTDIRAYQFTILMIGGCVVIIFLLFYVFVHNLLKNIINPISELSQTMRCVSEDEELKKCEVHGVQEIKVIERTYNDMIDTINHLLIENKCKEQEKHEEEMKVLELQLNPHFLSNTLSSIRFMAIIAKYESIQKMTEAVIQILDSSFRNSSNTHSLKEELSMLESYVYIMSIRYLNNFEVYYDIDESCLDARVPKLVLQPFVENAITHGFEDREEFGEIHIKIQKKDDQLIISIRDNGNGVDKDRIHEILNKEPVPGKTIGIANINKRLKLYYGTDYKVEMHSEIAQYTEVEFSIPYTK